MYVVYKPLDTFISFWMNEVSIYVTIYLSIYLYADKLYPAFIVALESTVRSGSDVKFICSSTDAPDTHLLLAYLCRNQTIIDVNMWKYQMRKAIFNIKRVQEDDEGNYSCVLSERPLAATELNACGGHSVFLQVYGENYKNINNIPTTKTGVRQAVGCVINNKTCDLKSVVSNRGTE